MPPSGLVSAARVAGASAGYSAGVDKFAETARLERESKQRFYMSVNNLALQIKEFDLRAHELQLNESFRRDQLAQIDAMNIRDNSTRIRIQNLQNDHEVSMQNDRQTFEQEVVMPFQEEQQRLDRKNRIDVSHIQNIPQIMRVRLDSMNHALEETNKRIFQMMVNPETGKVYTKDEFALAAKSNGYASPAMYQEALVSGVRESVNKDYSTNVSSKAVNAAFAGVASGDVRVSAIANEAMAREIGGHFAKESGQISAGVNEFVSSGGTARIPVTVANGNITPDKVAGLKVKANVIGADGKPTVMDVSVGEYLDAAIGTYVAEFRKGNPAGANKVLDRYAKTVAGLDQFYYMSDEEKLAVEQMILQKLPVGERFDPRLTNYPYVMKVGIGSAVRNQASGGGTPESVSEDVVKETVPQATSQAVPKIMTALDAESARVGSGDMTKINMTVYQQRALAQSMLDAGSISKQEFDSINDRIQTLVDDAKAAAVGDPIGDAIGR